MVHKNKNVYLILSECRIKTKEGWVDGILYINEDLSEGPFVRVKSEFEEKFRPME